MSEQRRDNKNRILRTGESQRQDGRYAYKFVDAFGKPKFVYSWKLVPTDRVPKGKRSCLSLREKEREIQRDRDDGIVPLGKRMTVCQLYERYTRFRSKVRTLTKRGRDQLLRILREDELGSRSIGDVRPSDAVAWALRMSEEKDYAYTTINNHRRSLSAAFFMAVQDDILRKNPFDFKLRDVLEDDTQKKVPLSPEQEEAFLSFVREDATYRRYYDEVVILLGTGLRISELCGLTKSDIDLDNPEGRCLHVDHQLLKAPGVGYYVDKPKTGRGERFVYLSAQVEEALERVMQRRGKRKKLVVGGHSDFLFLTKDGLPMVAGNYESAFRRMVAKYAKTDSVALPKVVTPHTLRHTFCTRMAHDGMNPKALQYIMGHASIRMTLDYYAHTDSASAIAEMRRLAA